ncbi:MAG TPA: winged helix-turn-helix domain-containing protein, partial [Bryobacteraceae bacterium]|nr:winged helix-turn-helix domain-containing protein [Bryobacteraceae bacterium]
MIYELGPFRLDTEARVLTHDGAATALGARGVAVLAVLVSRAGEYVDKSVIMDAAWPDVVVEEDNLTVQVSAIRRVLARVPGGKEWIETLTRRGYRFVGPVVRLSEEPADTSADAPGLPARASHHPAPPALRSLESVPNNLPEQLTSFIGRERELAELRKLLGSTRLLLLRGTGGIGKTRLALQLAAQAMDDYPDGVWFIDLAAITDPQLV